MGEDSRSRRIGQATPGEACFGQDDCLGEAGLLLSEVVI